MSQKQRLLGLVLKACQAPMQGTGAAAALRCSATPTLVSTPCQAFLMPRIGTQTLRTWAQQLSSCRQHAFSDTSNRLWSSLAGRASTPPQALGKASASLRPGGVKGLGPALAARHASNVTSKVSSSTGKVLRHVHSSLGPRLSTALTMRLHSWWQRHGNLLYFGVGGLAVYLIWRLLFTFTSAFVTINSMFAEYGFMALAASIVLLSFLYIRSYYAVDPAKVYRLTMRRLNTSPAVLEVLGVPLVGSELRASVLTGGGLYLGKGMAPKLRPRRCQMIFPLHGSERRGLVSLEAKKKQGKYVFKLLAVDVMLPAGTGNTERPAAQQRLYVDGDLQLYNRGGILNELRDPFLRALSLEKAYEAEDEVEDELAFLQQEREGARVRAKAEAKDARETQDKANEERAAAAAGGEVPAAAALLAASTSSKDGGSVGAWEAAELARGIAVGGMTGAGLSGIAAEGQAAHEAAERLRLEDAAAAAAATAEVEAELSLAKAEEGAVATGKDAALAVPPAPQYPWWRRLLTGDGPTAAAPAGGVAPLTK